MIQEAWAKSSHSPHNGGCLEARWQKSSFSFSNGNCVEARDAGVVQVRDSKLGEASAVLSFTPEAWRGFLARIS